MPVWLASNLYPIWVTYRLLRGFRALIARRRNSGTDEAMARFPLDGVELDHEKDRMLKFWVMHAVLRLFGGIVSRGTFTGAWRGWCC